MRREYDNAKGQKRMPQISSLHRLKRLLEGSFPRFYNALRWRWYRHVLRRMVNVIVVQHGLVVQNGPFEGMQYIPEMLNSEELLRHDLLPKILGCYEAELHTVLRWVSGRDYKLIVNIGCSEGYYSIGLSLRLSGARVFAFDLNPAARRFCEQMARLNGVADRVTVRGECTPKDLQALAGKDTLVVCDCEGCELALLCPDLVPGLSACDLIVELHDCINPSISRVVCSRFYDTHEVKLLSTCNRDASAYPPAERFSLYEQRLALKEFRWGGPPAWAFMASKYNERL
jgi:hypothetical protein